MIFEHRTEPLLPKRHYYDRVMKSTAAAIAILAFSLLFGMVGYRHIAGIDWVPAFYNASMILTGMGPALQIEDLCAERQAPTMLFAGFYAIFSGVFFLAASGLVLSPILHRFFHKMHLDVRG